MREDNSKLNYSPIALSSNSKLGSIHAKRDKFDIKRSNFGKKSNVSKSNVSNSNMTSNHRNTNNTYNEKNNN